MNLVVNREELAIETLLEFVEKWKLISINKFTLPLWIAVMPRNLDLEYSFTMFTFWYAIKLFGCEILPSIGSLSFTIAAYSFPFQIEVEVFNGLITQRVIAYDARSSRLARVIFILLEEKLRCHWLLAATAAATNPRIEIVCLVDEEFSTLLLLLVDVDWSAIHEYRLLVACV